MLPNGTTGSFEARGDASGMLHPPTAAVAYPRGTVAVRVPGDVVAGTFDPEGEPFGVDDPEVRVRVQGRFEIPFQR